MEYQGKGGRKVSFSLQALLKDEKKKTFLATGGDRSQLLFVEELLKQRLPLSGVAGDSLLH